MEILKLPKSCVLMVKTLKYNPLWTGALEYILLHFYYMSLFSQCLCLPMLKPFSCVYVCAFVFICTCVYRGLQRSEVKFGCCSLGSTLLCFLRRSITWLGTSHTDQADSPGICLPQFPSDNNSFTAIRLQAQATVLWLRCWPLYDKELYSKNHK